MRIEATHVNNTGAWSPDLVWGWNSCRPLNGEPNKRLSTAWNWTSQDLPLKPLNGFTKSKLTFPSANTAVVECLIDTNTLTDDTSIIAKIEDSTKALRNVHIETVNKIRLPSITIDLDRGNRACKIPTRAFATLDSIDWEKNSRLGLAYKFDAITVSLIRQRDGAEIPAPGIAVAFPHQSDAVGFVIDWRQLTKNGGTELDQGCY